MNWHRRQWAVLSRLGVVALLAAPPAHYAAAQGYNPPGEETVAELRQNLEAFISYDRQLQLLGFPPNPNIELRQIELLEADFDENIMPGLDFAEKDCFFAEVPVKAALDWTRQVQLLGFGDDLGPLWLEASIVQESLLKILKNCHKEMYQACLLDDTDPIAALLPGVTRQLSLMDGDPIYEDKNRRCAFGWHGKVTTSETIQGNQTRTDSVGATSSTTRVVLSGNRDLSVESPNKVDATTGRVDGRATQHISTVGKAGKCTVTFETEWLRVSSGSGEAMLRKHSSDAGALLLSFSGPVESGSQKMTASATVNDSKCGGQSKQPDTSTPLPARPWPGLISDTLGDPYTEVISGTRTLYWAINATGQAVPARGASDGSVSRVPAIPGAPAISAESGVQPWLRVSQPLLDAQGEPPTIKMDVTWNLVFGEG